MSIRSGIYTLGPAEASLTVHTGKGGAASKAGHNLVIEVETWRATLEITEDPAGSSLTLSADSRSLRVREGSGGVKPLSEDDKANIKQTIADEVLKGCAIGFRSAAVRTDGGGSLAVEGELDLFGRTRPLTFAVNVGDDGRLSGEATVRHSDFGVKPYSALFGALKVADEVRIGVDGRLPAA